MKQAVAYIRKSVVHKGDRVLSAEVQEAEVRKLASRFGDTDLVVLSDIGRSGRKVGKRPGYLELLSRIDAGTVGSVYAYSLSRLNRSTKDYAHLADLCVSRSVPVRLVHEGEQDFSTPTGRLIATILSAVAQMQAEIDSERARDVIRQRVANGERHGESPYGSKDGEDPDAVVAAFIEAGSYHGAARILNGDGVRTRRGGPWWATSVREVLKKHAPAIVPLGQVQRAKSAPPFALARLLRCNCGRIMTGVMQKGQRRYICGQGIDRPDHPRPKSIAEARLIQWIKGEAALARVPSAVEENTPHAERSALEDRLDKLSRQHEMGILDDAELAARARDIEDALERLGTATIIMDVPTDIDWENDSPEAVNHVLRALWEYVQLGAELMPVEAIWRVPQWRGK